MRNVLLSLVAAAMLAGCYIPPKDAPMLSEYIVAESDKLRSVEIGMSLKQVEGIMGPSPGVFWLRYPDADVVREARPVRTEKFKTKDGRGVVIYFYRSAEKDGWTKCTDDETTAVVFVDGKVDALLPGEKSKEVIEVRFR